MSELALELETCGAVPVQDDTHNNCLCSTTQHRHALSPSVTVVFLEIRVFQSSLTDLPGHLFFSSRVH